MKTTISIFDEDLKVINRWCDRLKMTQAELIKEWIRRVLLHDQAKFYDSLDRPDFSRKPLENKRIQKSYKK